MQALKMPPLKVPTAAYSQVFYIAVYASSTIKNFVRTFMLDDILAAIEGSFIIVSIAALENVFCTFGVGILSVCGAQNAAQTVSNASSRSPLSPPRGSAPDVKSFIVI